MMLPQGQTKDTPAIPEMIAHNFMSQLLNHFVHTQFYIDVDEPKETKKRPFEVLEQCCVRNKGPAGFAMKLIVQHQHVITF